MPCDAVVVIGHRPIHYDDPSWDWPANNNINGNINGITIIGCSGSEYGANGNVHAGMPYSPNQNPRAQMDYALDPSEIANLPYQSPEVLVVGVNPCTKTPTDWSSNYPTVFQGAVMSELAYHARDTYIPCLNTLRNQGWKVADDEAEAMGLVLHDPDTGLDCTLLKKADGSGYAFVFAGTDISKMRLSATNVGLIMSPFLSGVVGSLPKSKLLAAVGLVSSIPDLKTDVYQTFYGMDAQYYQAFVNAILLHAQLGQNVPLTFVGHSLGGGEATLASLVTGRPALIYNPAELSKATHDMIEEIGFSTDESPNIYRYVMEGDYVTGGQELLNDLGAELIPHGIRNNIINGTEGDAHSCKTMIDNISCNESVNWNQK